jgi:hypothetical protein
MKNVGYGICVRFKIFLITAYKLTKNCSLAKILLCGTTKFFQEKSLKTSYSVGRKTFVYVSLFRVGICSLINPRQCFLFRVLPWIPLQFLVYIFDLAG